jgi:hypothetical protein
MKNLKVTISQPNPYKSKVTETPMVSYVVTGTPEAVEAYRADLLAQGITSEDDKGNPLAHYTKSASAKYGETAELERTTSSTGETYWFMDNAEQKNLDELIAGSDSTTKAIYASQKIEELKAFAKVLAQNRNKNIAMLQAKTANKSVDSI